MIKRSHTSWVKGICDWMICLHYVYKGRICNVFTFSCPGDKIRKSCCSHYLLSDEHIWRPVLALSDAGKTLASVGNSSWCCLRECFAHLSHSPSTPSSPSSSFYYSPSPPPPKLTPKPMAPVVIMTMTLAPRPKLNLHLSNICTRRMEWRWMIRYVLVTWVKGGLMHSIHLIKRNHLMHLGSSPDSPGPSFANPRCQGWPSPLAMFQVMSLTAATFGSRYNCKKMKNQYKIWLNQLSRNYFYWVILNVKYEQKSEIHIS